MKIETERKFLIRRPEEDVLFAQEDLSVLEIVQTYLTGPGVSPERRLRLIRENGRTSYIFTQKTELQRDGAAVSREETEYEIPETEYLAMREEAYSELAKTRYRFPYDGHTMEIDVYPPEIGGKKLEGLAVLEVELEKGDEPFSLPSFLSVEKEITGGSRYSNKKLAKRVKKDGRKQTV